MQFTNENIKDLVESFVPFIKRLIKEETSDCLRIDVAKVISVDEDAGTCVIRFASTDALLTDDERQEESENDFTVCNKYGIEVEPGDFVNVQYWNNSTDMYIVSKFDGSSELSGGKPIEKTNIPVPRSAWNGTTSCTITVTDAELTVDSIVFVQPTIATRNDWINYAVVCTASGTDSLSFACQELPPDVACNIVVWNV